MYYNKLGIRALPRELKNDLKLRILANQVILENYENKIRTQLSVRSHLQNSNFWQNQSKNTQKQIYNLSCSVRFFWISLICSKYFVQDGILLRLFTIPCLYSVFSVFDQKYTFWVNFLQKIYIFSSSLNLVLRLIRICKFIQRMSRFLFQTRKYFFLKKKSFKKSKLSV